MRKKFSLIIAVLFAVSMTFSTAAADPIVITGNKIGSYDKFDYEFWRDKGDAVMTMYEGGRFDCSWDKNKTNNALFRAGKKLGSVKTHDEIGNIYLEYGCDYNPEGNSYLCVYGWSVDPLVEFYIVESWGNWRPPGSVSKGTVDIDGGKYDIYETTRTNQPSIQGTATFQQYWSVRTSKSIDGKISVSEHFKAWEEAGMSLGKMYEVSFCVEAYQSSGSANVYKNILTIGSTTIGSAENNANNKDNTGGAGNSNNTSGGTDNTGGKGNSGGSGEVKSTNGDKDTENVKKTAETKKTQKALSAPKVKGSKSGKNLVLSWDKIEGANGYRVYLYNAETKKYEKIKSVKGEKATIKNIEKGSYKFKVTAVEKTSSGLKNGNASKVYSVNIK